MTEGALREKRAGVKGLLRFFDAKQIVISSKASREKDVDRESASAAMGTSVPGVAQKKTGPTGLAPHPDPCLPEAFAPRACGRRTMGKERNWKTKSPESQGRKLPALIKSSNLQPFLCSHPCLRQECFLLILGPRPGSSVPAWWITRVSVTLG